MVSSNVYSVYRKWGKTLKWLAMDKSWPNKYNWGKNNILINQDDVPGKEISAVWVWLHCDNWTRLHLLLSLSKAVHTYNLSLLNCPHAEGKKTIIWFSVIIVLALNFQNCSFMFNIRKSVQNVAWHPILCVSISDKSCAIIALFAKPWAAIPELQTANKMVPYATFYWECASSNFKWSHSCKWTMII